MLMHSPRKNQAIRNFDKSKISTHNFNSVPAWGKLNSEFAGIVNVVLRSGFEVVEIADLLDAADVQLLEQNPNSMFTRDALITLPWNSKVAIVANMALNGRRTEPTLLHKASKKLGVKIFFTPPPDIHMEGGDFLAVMQNGKRTLYVGAGARTHADAAMWIAKNLIPHYVDEVVCLRHNLSMLHLDTCFTILPNQTVVCARNTITGCFVISSDLAVKHWKAHEYFADNGYSIIWITQANAAQDEDCNILYLGGTHYLSFTMSDRLSESIERTAAIQLQQLDGTEIAKANGGVHCLTRPIY
jgi:N-dimethylarginine dimethylaminohydrolase